MFNQVNQPSVTFEFIVKYLVEFIAWININDSELEEIIKHAINNNDFKELASTLKKIGPKRRSQVTSMILQTCSLLNKTELIDSLIDQQLFNPHVWKDRYDWSPLHRAVYKRDLALVKILISKGVDIRCREINGNTPLHIAIQNVRNPPSGHNEESSKRQLVDIVALLLSADAKGQGHHCKSPESLLVNIRNNFGKSALHYCVDLDPSPMTIELIYMLIQGGALVDQVDFKGRTAFHFLTAEFKRNLTCCSKTSSPSSKSSAASNRIGGSTDRPTLSRSPFIDLLIELNCDTLNYNSILGKVPSLKSLCRQLIQTHFNSNNFDCLTGYLPDELIHYLNRLLVK